MGLSFSGVVLAAGRSRRMGRDKALLEVDGVRLWRRQRDVLAAAGAPEVYLSARPDQQWIIDTDRFAGVLFDAFPDCGPISGITAALERTSRSHVGVLAIDLPALPSAWFAQLAAQCGDKVGCVGRRDGYFEPLAAAIYPVEMKWLAWEAFARGEYGLQPLLAQAEQQGLIRVVDITPAQAPWFRNWNDASETSAP